MQRPHTIALHEGSAILRTGLNSRLQRLGPVRVGLLMRAGVILSLSSAAVALLPFRRALAYGSAKLGNREGSASVPELVWAVETVARRLPLRALCIERGIAVQRLLRKAGIDARLHYGAHHEARSGHLQAHVWVTVDGEPVIGGEEAEAFSEIATFP